MPSEQPELPPLTPEQAENVLDGARHLKRAVSQHRWYTKYLIVFGDIGGHYGFYYMEPATEMQEGQDEFELDKDGNVPLFRVHGVDRTITEWRIS